MIVKLGSLISEYSVRNKADEDIPVYSVTNEQGFCTGYFSKEVASQDRTTYKIVPRGCFAYNPSRINVGSVDVQECEDRVIVSPLYVVFSVNEKLNRRYLLHYLKSDITLTYIKAYASGSVRDNLKFSILKEFPINLPSAEEQEQIVATLDGIEHLIALRKEELASLDELVKSRFIELFGDPATNPKGWITKPLLDMGYCKNGMNFHTGDSGIEMHCLGVGDFKDLSVIDGTESLPVISLKEAPPEESMLRDGDIVFVRSNGNKALVGRCLVVYPHNTPTTYSGFCIRYRLTSSEVNTAYLLRVLKADSMRKKMTGRGANIQNLNQQILATLDIPLPPTEQQQQFAAFVEQTDKSKLAIQQSLDKLETLKKTLMQKYFG